MNEQTRQQGEVVDWAVKEFGAVNPNLTRGDYNLMVRAISAGMMSKEGCVRWMISTVPLITAEIRDYMRSNPADFMFAESHCIDAGHTPIAQQGRAA